MPDHVHLFVESDPGMAPAKLAAQFKGYTSRVLRQEFRHLRSQLPTLWSRSYGVWTEGRWHQSKCDNFVNEQPRRS
jgi:putative transposase